MGWLNDWVSVRRELSLVRNTHTLFLTGRRAFWHWDVIITIHKLLLDTGRRTLGHDNIVVRVWGQVKGKPVKQQPGKRTCLKYSALVLYFLREVMLQHL